MEVIFKLKRYLASSSAHLLKNKKFLSLLWFSCLNDGQREVQFCSFLPGWEKKKTFLICLFREKNVVSSSLRFSGTGERLVCKDFYTDLRWLMVRLYQNLSGNLNGPNNPHLAIQSYKKKGGYNWLLVISSVEGGRMTGINIRAPTWRLCAGHSSSVFPCFHQHTDIPKLPHMTFPSLLFSLKKGAWGWKCVPCCKGHG